VIAGSATPFCAAPPGVIVHVAAVPVEENENASTAAPAGTSAVSAVVPVRRE